MHYMKIILSDVPNPEDGDRAVCIAFQCPSPNSDKMRIKDMYGILFKEFQEAFPETTNSESING